MAINELEIDKTRRLSFSLMGASGAFLFAVINIAANSRIAGNIDFANKLAPPSYMLSAAFLFGLLALIFVEIADSSKIPKEGHPHSQQNYLQSSFVFLFPLGILTLIVGAGYAMSAVFN